jgi:protein-arginine kinase activator protein McsA
MLCERCGQRPATVHITEIAGGNKKETHICHVCAGELQPQGMVFNPKMNLNNFLAGSRFLVLVTFHAALTILLSLLRKNITTAVSKTAPCRTHSSL